MKEESVRLLMDIGVGYLKADQPGKALDYIVKAKSLKQPIKSLDYLRACCFLELDRQADCLQALQEELRYFPDNAEARALLQRVWKVPDGSRVAPGDTEFQALLSAVLPYTMLSEERLFSIYCLTRGICEKGIQGNFVECGVAAGGSTAVIAYVAKKYSRQPRFIYAFDSFEGMPEPTEHDLHDNVAANATGWGAGTCSASESSVREICSRLGVSDLVTTVKGYFQETLPKMRDRVGMIAFLHLDADRYESTSVILRCLYDRVVNDGIFQVDDFGFWEGCRKAVHEFESQRRVKLDIHTIDSSGVWFAKPERFQLNPEIPIVLVREFMEDDPSVPAIESQMSLNERFQLYYLLRTMIAPRDGRPLRFVEIGSYAGASLYLTCRALLRTGKPFQGFAIEPCGKPRFHEVASRFSSNVAHVKLFSSEAAPLLQRFFEKDTNLPEFIFVDGDHSYEGVCADINNYYPLLAPGGMMAFHDYLPPLDHDNREAILFHHGGMEPGIRRACRELMEGKYGCEVLDIPLLHPTDPTQTQPHLPIIPGVYSTMRVYRKSF